MRILSMALAAVICCAGAVTSTFADDAPRTFQYDGGALLKSREKFRAGDAAIVDRAKALLGNADRALKIENLSVVNKPFTAPSGDKHDYMSLSPYWWPDPSKPDGKPYIRKDGEVNPERLKYDQPVIDQFTDAVDTLALAYFFTGEEKYASKCAQMIRAWCFDDATRMNPNVRYAQYVMGMGERPSGCLEGMKMRKVVDADGLLSGSKNWSSDDREKLRGWFKEYLSYLQTSKQGKEELKAPNNHGSWVTVQMSTYALYLGDDALAKKLIDEQGHKRIKSQIEPDGRQPLELERTKAYDYSRFNLEALCNIAMLGQRVDVDLWNFKTEDGRSIRAALDWLAPYASGEKTWEGKQITDPKMLESARVYRLAANAYHDEKCEKLVQAIRQRGKIDPGDRTDLLFPATTK